MSDFDRKKLNYRKGTQAFILKNNKILMFQSVHFKNNEWSLPGGGLKSNETPTQALERELKEEFPDNKFEIISMAKTQLVYEWSEELIINDLNEKGYSYRGQSKTQFLVHLKDDDIVSFDNTEIRKIKWVETENVIDYLLPDRKEQTIQALKELKIIN